jgi:hypothetical protein
MKSIQGIGDPAVLTRRQLIARLVGAAVGLNVALAAIVARAAEPDAGGLQTLTAEKTRKETEKLVGEIDKLKFENGFWGRLIPLVGIPTLGFVASGLAAWLTIQSGRKETLKQIGAEQERTMRQLSAERENALEQIRAEVNHATHEKRLDCYAELTKAMSPFALFFPDGSKLDHFRCLQIGDAMSRWYFTTGGLLLSSEARDDYFRLARSVTKAFLSDGILAPDWNEHAKLINDKTMDGYRKTLNLSIAEWDKKTEEEKKNWEETVESWEFGEQWPEDKKKILKKSPADGESVDNACAFKDYILLQTVSSRLRSALTEDIASRRRPLN